MAESGEGKLTLAATDELAMAWAKARFGEEGAVEAYLLLGATWRRLSAGQPGIQLSDVLYVVHQSRQNGLPPFGNFYALIPRDSGKSCSVCFTLDAALDIITHHSY